MGERQVEGTVRDYDYHPDEPDSRVFVTPARGVLRLDDEVLVTEVRWDSESILRHYAFEDRWLKVNVSRTNSGAIVDFNCDIATPMLRDGDEVYAVDLFIDVLIDNVARQFRVQDEDEFDGAHAAGLISGGEARAARSELARLVGDIEAGRLMPWLDGLCSMRPPDDPPPVSMQRAPVPAVLAPPRQWPPAFSGSSP